jgi:hypothetical protein
MSPEYKAITAGFSVLPVAGKDTGLAENSPGVHV